MHNFTTSETICSYLIQSMKQPLVWSTTIQTWHTKVAPVDAASMTTYHVYPSCILDTQWEVWEANYY